MASAGAPHGPIALALEPRFKVGLFLNGGFDQTSFRLGSILSISHHA